MSRETSPAISTSNPVMSPVIGSRKDSKLLRCQPTISRPLARMVATAASDATLLVNGRRLAVGSQLFVVRLRSDGERGEPTPPCRPGWARPVLAPVVPGPDTPFCRSR